MNSRRREYDIAFKNKWRGIRKDVLIILVGRRTAAVNVKAELVNMSVE